MTDSPAQPNIPPSTSPIGNTFDADTLAPRELRVVLVCDVVESVRWMEQDEDDAVSRWQAFTQHVRSTIVPAHGASVVKSTGDGMMIEFASARSAVQASAAMHSAAALANAGIPHERHMLLRTGIHETHARRDAFDLYGHGVNLAARITTLAGPGETIVSAPVRDHLTDALDGDIEDMGECYLKHIAEPQRVYRVGTASAEPILVPVREYAEPLQPTIAVIPFESRSHAPEDFAIGELIADGVIGQLSRTIGLTVLSRLSTSVFRNKNYTTHTIAEKLNANYICSGSYLAHNGKLLLQYEIVETANNYVVRSERLAGAIDDLFSVEGAICQQVADHVHHAVLSSAAHNALSKPMPNLHSYSMLLGGISLMHRNTSNDFQHARTVLEALVERHPKQAMSYAWLAKWYVLQVTQTKSMTSAQTMAQALSLTSKALDLEHANSQSLAMRGFVQLHIAKNIAAAQADFALALEVNPNDPQAWLFSSVANAFIGESKLAVDASRRALALSPFDPLRYYFESLAASSAIADSAFTEATLLCRQSLKKNSRHMHTHRALITALWFDGQEEQSRAAAKRLLAIDPDFRVNKFVHNSASAVYPFGKNMAFALTQSGIPFS